MKDKVDAYVALMAFVYDHVSLNVSFNHLCICLLACYEALIIINAS